MARTTTIAVLFALLLILGMTATGAALPSDVAEPAEDGADNASDQNPVADGERGPEAAENADDNRSDRANTGGPPVELPSTVPDHVSNIHDRIHHFLNGSVSDVNDRLGDAVREVAGSDDDDSSDPEGPDQQE